MALRLVHTQDVQSYWTATTEGDVEAAYAVFCAVLDRGVPLGDVLDRLIAASQARVGDLWACNRWTVLQEHHATSVNERVLDRLSARRTGVARGPRVLLTCVEQEWHTMATTLLAVKLRVAGVRVDYRLGEVDAAELAHRISRTRPRAVLLSASLVSSLGAAASLVELVRDLRTPVMVGGSAFDREGLRARRIGATAYAATADEALPVLIDLPVRTDSLPDLVPPEVREAERIRACSADLSSLVLDDLCARLDLSLVADLPPEDWRGVLVTSVPYVVDSVAGALLTRDPSVLTQMQTWLDEVLQARDADPRSSVELWSSLQRQLLHQPHATALLADLV
ncbi:cobalamin-dependent protein [Nocardioides psychrotolerans]|uniref:cobalamin B12-binding domain-containing protein n=1 Tax=Nocardioides psychrotolerans TaxID=1005945 RepID=UPI003137EFA0